MKIYKTIIIGSGAAAYSAADWLFKEGIDDIAILTENRLYGTSRNTGSDKQTYYKLSMDGFTPDSPYKMARDMFSGGCCDGEKMYLEAMHSQRCFTRLCEYGVPFPENEYGGYPGYKTDHDDTLRATSVGPLTSKAMTEKLERVVIEKNKTPLFDNRLVTKILKDEKGIRGVRALDTKRNIEESFYAENVICATGAPACIYEDSVYPVSQHGMTGVLIDAGVRMCNFTQWQYGMASTDFRWNVSGSFMQVVPRFVSVDHEGKEHEFLGEYFSDLDEAYSLVFLKGYQWPFSYERSTLSSKIDLAVHSETEKGRTVYLDYRKNPKDFSFEKLSEEARKYLTDTGCVAATPVERLKKLNEKAIAVYLRQGIDLHRDMLKIAVCAQHNNGGVYTDLNFETDIDGLYVIGEASGSFGLSRPGGSALNDTQISGFVAARHIKNKPSRNITVLKEDNISKLENFAVDETVDYSRFKKEMSRIASFKRDYEGCVALLERIKAVLASYPERHKSFKAYYKDKDMLISMRALLQAIVAEQPETGSRGGAIFIKEGRVIKEAPAYRNFMSVMSGEKLEYIKVTPVPQKQRPFEYYLNKIDEGELI